MKDNFVKINHISESNKNIISDENNDQDNLPPSQFSKHKSRVSLKRKQCNPSSDQFLNLNTVK